MIKTIRIIGSFIESIIFTLEAMNFISNYYKEKVILLLLGMIIFGFGVFYLNRDYLDDNP